uniref:Uncharacterized protein n=1 Tax=Meloidogyne enterolobii TaxID=390850 RepID=A0A6V7WFR5_MELEN|nr:unnamed protein product [Meloidogyne enterolobii]
MSTKPDPPQGANAGNKNEENEVGQKLFKIILKITIKNRKSFQEL